MRKFLILSLTVLASSLLTVSLAEAQVDDRCTTHQVACESEPGLGVNDDCCQCPGNEETCDTDGNGFIDGCCSRDTEGDACHGRYGATDTSTACDGTAHSCCRIPTSRNTLAKDPCHGHEGFTDTCPRDGVLDSCCIQRRTRVKPTP